MSSLSVEPSTNAIILSRGFDPVSSFDDVCCYAEIGIGRWNVVDAIAVQRQYSMRFLPALLSVRLFSCADFEEPPPLDPRASFGCYGDGENRVTMNAEGIVINGDPLPYVIQQHKVGLVVVLPAIFIKRDGTLQPKGAAEHHYRLIVEDTDRRLVIVDQDA